MIVDNGTSYLKKLKTLLVDNELKIIESTHVSSINQNENDLIILSGGHGFPVMDKQNPYAHEIELVKNSTGPILGICLGYEIIAHAFGAKLELMEGREKGLLEISPIGEDALFKNITNFSVYESHRWIVKQLPSELIGLATSKDGYEIIKHENRPIFGFQFHPEMFTEQACGDEIFRNFLEVIRQ